jgi:O-antigen/teichoic acid export membrane protein
MSPCSTWSKLRRSSPFAANAIITLGVNIVLAMLGMISGIFSARLLGPHGRGELAAIQTWPSVVATLAMIGMPEAVVYFSAREPSEAGRYLSLAVVVALVSSVPFMWMAYLLTPLMLHAQASAIVRDGRWYLLLVPIFALVGMLPNSLRGRGDFASWNFTRVMPNILLIGVLVLAWISSHAMPTFVAIANLVVLALLAFPFAALVASRVPGPFTPDLQKLPKMLHYGLPCMMTGMPQMLNLRLDQMLMAALLPAHDLGLYVVAVAWSGSAAPLLTSVSAVMTPAVASATDVAQGARRLAAGTRGTAALALVLCVILAVFTPIAITSLFGKAFSASIPAAVVLMFAAGVLSLNLVLQEGLRGLGRPYAVLRAELAGLVVTVVALATMLRPMGIMGAAIASLLGYSMVLGVLLINARRYASVSLRELLLAQLTEIRRTFESLLLLIRRHPSVTGDSL